MAAAAAGIVTQGAQAASKGGKKPNIVFFLGEGVRWDEFSFAGNTIIQTPNIDRLASEGAIFRNAFCVNALCAPSRATVMTGAYSHTTGARDNLENKVPDNFAMISDVLHQNGYDVAFFGKNHIKGALQDHYWDYYLSYDGQGQYYNPSLVEGRNGKFDESKQFDGYLDDILCEHAVSWLKGRDQNKPFCLFFWFYAPHAPFSRSRRAADRFNGVRIPKPVSYDEDIANYPGKPRGVAIAFNKMVTTMMDNARSLEEIVKDHYCGVEHNDDSVGRIVKVLAERNALDDTAIMLSSDHGFFLGEHSFYDKRLMYEPSIRIPLIIRYPHRIKAGTSKNEMALTVDFASTVYDIAGVTQPDTVQGRSLMPLAEGKKVADWRRDWLYEFFEYPGFENIRPHRGVRTERYKYIHYFLNPQEYELYDLQSDPDEMHNLYGKSGYEEITKKLQQRLTELRRETNDHYEWTPSGWGPMMKVWLHDRVATTEMFPSKP
jgi:arylsulfatase A-like enzyme